MNNQKTAYYAHCRANYGTDQEARDLGTIARLGFKVINPNDNNIQEEFKVIKESEGDRVAFEKSFLSRAASADVLIFRALPDGSILAGVAKEIEIAKANNVPVIELPSSYQRRFLNRYETREYLLEVGQR